MLNKKRKMHACEIPDTIKGKVIILKINIQIFIFVSCLQNGYTALHAAVMSGNLQSVLLLLGANADPTLLNKVG